MRGWKQACAGAVWALAAALPIASAAEPTVSYSEKIQPLLKQNCHSCHGAEQRLSELDLLSREAMLKGGLRGPAIVPGDAGKSRLYRQVAGLDEPRMPLGGKLKAAEIELLRSWIDQGAPVDAEAAAASSAEKPKGFTEKERNWWAFRAPVRNEPPAVSDRAWRRNPIDAFLSRRFEEKGLAPAPEADRRTLIRRAYLDLIGLLPTDGQVEAFLADRSPDAFRKVVDGLLESSHYGERWGRHWLDVVRYADSSGYEHDYDYPHAWRYRDYVIKSFNEDKPYDRFITEQLAGDELEDWNYDTLVATGFYRIGARILFREKDNPQYRYNYLDDMIATAGRGFLALSVNCARCHDHKFDPIRQLDYYRMMAIFLPHVRYEFPLVPAKEAAEYERGKAEIKALVKPLRARIGAIEKPYKARKFQAKLAKFPADIQEAFHTPEGERSDGQKLLFAQVSSIGAGAVSDMLSDEDRAAIKMLKERIEAIEKNLPADLPLAMGVRDGDYRSAPDGLGDEVQPGKGDRIDYEDAGPWIPKPGEPYEPPPAHFMPTADYRNLGPEIEPGVLQVLAGKGEFRPVPPNNGRVSTGRRLAFARWVASEENPLTARVMVNRIWQHHFGRGIVYTASNFGRMGQRPSHPELLDWLADEFVRRGWSMKAMHRLMMTSKTYRMSSSFYSEANAKIDPENIDHWRFRQRRLEGEIIRDIVLHASAKLNLKAGGEPFFPPIPQAVRDSFLKGRWEMDQEGEEVWRRSIYAYWKRGLVYPLFEVFDQPNMNVSCERRTTTTVPTQALTLLNNKFVLRQAALFAERVALEAGGEEAREIETAYRIALSRPPRAGELDDNLTFLSRQRAYHEGRSADPGVAALTDLCDVILNLNEFVYMN